MFNDVEASFQYHVAPAFLTGISYNYTRGSEVTGKVGGMNYTVSPRTNVYAAIIYQTVNGRDSTGAAAVANVNDVSPSTNQHQTVGRMGIRTRF